MNRLLKRLHPQGIPWPASVLYNRLSQTRIFRDHYKLVAEEITGEIRLDRGPVRILDIGTGPGFLLHCLAGGLPGIRVTGMDISPAMVDQARQNLKTAGMEKKISLCGGDAAALPFDDAAFDCIVSTGAFHHWKHPRAALDEIYRVLAPGGSALIYDLVRHLPPAMRKQIRQEFGSFRLALLWVHSFEEPFMDPEEMAALAAQTRFKTGEIRFTGGLCCLAMGKKNLGLI